MTKADSRQTRPVQARPWYLDAVFYQVHPRAFFDSDGDGVGDLRGLAAKLDHVRDLGADCIWLMPHYPSPLRDDGYDVADYFDVHPDLGTLDDFDALVAACRARGLKLVTDLVLNHVSSEHFWFREARRDPESPFREYFVWSDDGTGYREAPVIFAEVKTSNWTFDPAAGRYYWHRFFPHQPDLNYDHPAVGEAMLGVARFWLARGVDGFRVDAVPYLYEREGTACENLEETHAFCRRLRALVDREFPDAVLLCEANQPYETLLPYLSGDEFHLGFHFPLMPRLFVALAEGTARPVAEALRDPPPLPPGSGLVTFLRNHDELTLEKVTAEERARMMAVYGAGLDHTVNGGIPRRLAPLLGNDRRKIELLHAVILGLDPPPCFYYGDEIGMGGDPRLPDRFGVRTPMQWDGGPQAGFSTAAETWLPVISGGEYGYPRVNVARAESDPGAFLHRLRELIARRKASPALRAGRLELVPSPPELLAFRRVAADGETVLAVYNFSAEPQPLDAVPGAVSSDGRLESYGWRWLRAGQKLKPKL